MEGTGEEKVNFPLLKSEKRQKAPLGQWSTMLEINPFLDVPWTSHILIWIPSQKVRSLLLICITVFLHTNEGLPAYIG